MNKLDKITNLLNKSKLIIFKSIWNKWITNKDHSIDDLHYFENYLTVKEFNLLKFASKRNDKIFEEYLIECIQKVLKK